MMEGSQYTKAPRWVFGLAYDLAGVKIYGWSWSECLLDAYDRMCVFVMK